MNKAMLIFFITITPLFSQESQEAVKSLPMGFRGIIMGLSLEEAKKAIESDGYFDYRGDPDVSMLLTDNRAIIESSGKYYIKDGYFQFYNDTLYTITLVLDTRKIDYYTMFKTLTKKYGDYASLSPKQVLWENEKIRITLEKPLTIKYVGLGIFNKLIEDDTTKEAIEEELKRNFINEF